MTALLGEVADFLLRWAVWVLAVVVLAAAVAVPLRLVLGNRAETSVRGALMAAVGGAVVVASLAHRIGIDGPEVDVWRHALPWAWVLIGAALGVAAGYVIAARRD